MSPVVTHKKTNRVRIRFNGRANEVLSLLQYMVRHYSVIFDGERRWKNLCTSFLGKMRVQGSLLSLAHCCHLHVALSATKGIAHLTLDEDRGDVLFVFPEIYVDGVPLTKLSSPDYMWASNVFESATRVCRFEGQIQILVWMMERMDICLPPEKR